MPRSKDLKVVALDLKLVALDLKKNVLDLKMNETLAEGFDFT